MAQQETGQSRIWVWLVAVVAVAVIVFFVVQNNRVKVSVRVAQAERQDLVSTLSTNGKVEPIQDFEPRSPVPTSVSKVFVTPNQHVSNGQELLRLDDTGARKDLASAMATLAAAQAALRNMQNGGTADELLTEKNDLATAQTQLRQNQATLSSLQKLQAQGAASANEVATAQQQVTVAQIRITELQVRRKARYSGPDVAAQQALVTQAQAAVTAAQSTVASVDIRAPFAGTVYSLPISELKAVNSGDIMVGVADLTRLQVRAYFDEPEIGKLAVGEPVKIVWDAKPTLVWHGHITVAPTSIVDYGTRNVGVAIISVDDAKGDLLPNTNVTVTVTLQQRSNVLSLPREALHTDGARNFVYRLINDRLVATPVEVGAVNLTRFEVSSGIKEGDFVVLGPTTDADLRNGMRVKVQP